MTRSRHEQKIFPTKARGQGASSARAAREQGNDEAAFGRRGSNSIYTAWPREI